MNKIGIMQGRLIPPINNRIQSFPKESWQKEFPLAHELELECIEFIFDGEDLSNHPLMTAEGLLEIKKLESSNSIHVSSICADFFMTHPIHRGNTEQRGKYIQILKDLIKNCAKLDVNDIVIPCVDNSKFKNDDEILSFKSGIIDCVQLAQDCNLNLTLETDLQPADFIRLMNSVNSDNLKINYDTGNSAYFGYDPILEFQSYGQCVTDIHIKDRVVNGSTVPLGEGDVNFPLIFKLLKYINYQGVLILQTARKKPGFEKETIKGYLDFIGKYLQ